LSLSVNQKSRFPALSVHRKLLVVFLLAACAQTSGTARGIVIEVEGDLDEVTSFTVLVEGGEMTFLPVEGGAYDFPLSHLREHLRTGEPVLVTWELDGGRRVALALADG
jgi:hypothetical protein